MFAEGSTLSAKIVGVEVTSQFIHLLMETTTLPDAPPVTVRDSVEKIQFRKKNGDNMSLKNTRFDNAFPRVIKIGDEVGVRRDPFRNTFYTTDRLMVSWEHVKDCEVMEYFTTEQVIEVLETVELFFISDPFTRAPSSVFKSLTGHTKGRWMCNGYSYLDLDSVFSAEGTRPEDVHLHRPGSPTNLTITNDAW